MTLFIGFDVGGTKIEAVLMDMKGVLNGNLGPVLARERLPTERHLGYEAVVQKIATLAKLVLEIAKKNSNEVNGLGFAIPGSVHPETLCMVNGNTLILKNKPLPFDVKKTLGWAHVSVAAENDANLFALAEALCGAGKTHEKLIGKPVVKQLSVGVILGTGFGGGIVMNGDTLKGSRGGAAEVGHFSLFANGHPCYCGRKGCAEQYLSGPALEAAFNARRYSQISGFPGAREIFELAEQKDPSAVAVTIEYKNHLAKALGNICTLLDVDYFVFGGGMSKQKFIYENLEALVSNECFLPESKPSIYENVLGDSAGVFGAILIAQRAIEQKN